MVILGLSLIKGTIYEARGSQKSFMKSGAFIKKVRTKVKLPLFLE
jgi:hypothetical protein